MNCNICGSEKFIDVNQRPAVRCSSCGSYERTRLLFLYFEKLRLPDGSKILHIAPEKGLYERIKGIAGIEYTVADIDPSRYSFAPECRHIDLTEMDQWPSEQYDLIMHSHVIEHIPCTLAYPIYHIHRMLKRDGVHMCIIPFLSGNYDETLADIGDEERTRRFGQYDHVRRLGREDIGLHLGRIVKLPEKFDATLDFSEDQLAGANIPKNHWKGFHVGTVLHLRKNDYSLSF